MGIRKVYKPVVFAIDRIEKSTAREGAAIHPVWHVVGKFEPGAVRSKYETEYRIRVVPDERWNGLKRIAFLLDSFYESQSVQWRSRRHTYGTGKWYISLPVERRYDVDNRFTFEHFSVEQTAAS